MRWIPKRLKSHGFTLVELMIASMVFSVILLGATTAVIQVGRMYYKGVITSRTQEIARRTIDDIIQAVQLNDAQIVTVGPVQIPVTGISNGNVDVWATCVGNTRYSYVINAQVDRQNDFNKHRLRHALWQDTVNDPSECGAGLPDLGQDQPSENGRELLGRYMRLRAFNVDPIIDPTPVTIGVVYGDDDLLLPDAVNPESCKGAIQGAQWCAVSNLSTQVRQRLDPEE